RFERARILSASAVQDGEWSADQADRKLFFGSADSGADEDGLWTDWGVFNQSRSGDAGLLSADSEQLGGEAGDGGSTSERGRGLSEGGSALVGGAGHCECVS